MKCHNKAGSTMAMATAVICLAPHLVFSEIIAQDTFESYTLGPLSGQGGGIGWTGSWTAPGSVVRADVVDMTANPLSFSVPGGGLISGGTRALEVQLSGAPASQFAGVRTLATPIAQTFYVGYSVRYDASLGGNWGGFNNTFTLHLGTNSSSTTTLNFGLRGDGGGTANEFLIRYATGAPVAGASTGGQLVNDTDYYLVARVNWDGTAYNSANLWLNPSASADVDTPNGNASVTFTAFSNPITHIFWREAVLDADDLLRTDNLTLGTTWRDVVIPEPSSMALLGLGTLALGLIRRKS